MGKAGRPSGTNDKFDEETRGAFLLALERSGEYTAAAASVGVSYSCALDYRNRHPEFEEACKRARGRLIGELMASVRKMAIDGITVEEVVGADGKSRVLKKRFSERVLLKWLSRLERKWGDKVQVEQSGTVQHVHAGRIEVEQLTKEQRHAARRFLATLPDEPSRN